MFFFYCKSTLTGDRLNTICYNLCAAIEYLRYVFYYDYICITQVSFNVLLSTERFTAALEIHVGLTIFFLFLFC